MGIPADADLERPETLDVWPDPENERVFTPATVVTFIRTTASITLSGLGIYHDSLKLLVIALVVYWVGDSLDGQVARRLGYESRIGAVIDIFCDRFCAAAFYFGLAWVHHQYVVPVLIYLAEFMVIDCFLSITFLAWRIRSPNYFWVIDKRIWLLNWSHPGKAVNSGAFAILLLVTKLPILGAVIAIGLFVFKCWALAQVMKFGLPVPESTDVRRAALQQASDADEPSPRA